MTALNEPTVLIIDDEAEMRAFLKDALAGEGLALQEAASGEEGVQQAIARKPDLILLDLRMPAMDGAAVCKALRRNDVTERIPILVITGSLSREQIDESMTAGADDFIPKPIDVQDLRIRVRAMLRCKDIEDPAERLMQYIRTVRKMSEEVLPPADDQRTPSR
jgi:DNA-binding response OmpR family regulator